jgi:hypothetical protein
MSSRPQEPRVLQRGYGHRGGKVKGFEFVPMNQDVSRAALF